MFIDICMFFYNLIFYKMNYMYNWIDVIFFKIIWKNLVGWNEKKFIVNFNVIEMKRFVYRWNCKSWLNCWIKVLVDVGDNIFLVVYIYLKFCFFFIYFMYMYDL